MDIFTKSIVFAAEKHTFQKRKNGNNVPYINHPLEVTHILARAGITDVNILSAGALHDTVEDTKTTP